MVDESDALWDSPPLANFHRSPPCTTRRYSTCFHPAQGVSRIANQVSSFCRTVTLPCAAQRSPLDPRRRKRRFTAVVVPTVTLPGSRCFFESDFEQTAVHVVVADFKASLPACMAYGNPRTPPPIARAHPGSNISNSRVPRPISPAPFFRILFGPRLWNRSQLMDARHMTLLMKVPLER